jgi:hypothetical protein
MMALMARGVRDTMWAEGHGGSRILGDFHVKFSLLRIPRADAHPSRAFRERVGILTSYKIAKFRKGVKILNPNRIERG